VDEKRLIDIEVKLAHQEHALDEVSDVLTAQQAQLDHLDRLCQTLIERLRSISEPEPAENHGAERPPHY
jgi:SlyX protein